MWVYIMSNPWSRVLYVGVTNDIIRRVWEHKQRKQAGFTQKYNVTSLVYVEEHAGPGEAIEREKQIKGWLRSRKLALVESANPEFTDLAEGWYCDGQAPDSSVAKAPSE
jgi:putative endonuclease